MMYLFLHQKIQNLNLKAIKNVIGRVELRKSNCVNRNVNKVNADVFDEAVVNEKGPIY